MDQPPFHNPNSDPLPDANDVEAEFRGKRERQPDAYHSQLSDENRAHLQKDTRRLRNFFIGLIVVGVIVGGLLSIGLVWTMSRFDMINPPTLNENR